MPRAAAGVNVEWSAEDDIYSGFEVPCENGTQTWEGYYYPGLITTHPTGTEDTSIRGEHAGAGGAEEGRLSPGGCMRVLV
jgi:hypothetical protein